jgi:hypothetical protein
LKIPQNFTQKNSDEEKILQRGGGGGIRTPETLSGLTVFKTAAFNRSATPPLLSLTGNGRRFQMNPNEMVRENKTGFITSPLLKR